MKNFKKSVSILLIALLLSITPSSLVQASAAGCNCKETPAKIYVTSYIRYGRDISGYFYDSSGNKVYIYKDYRQTVLVWRYSCSCCGASTTFQEYQSKEYY